MVAIYGSSPWTRNAIKNLTPDQLQAIADVLPDSMFVTLGAPTNPHTYTVHLMADEPGKVAVEVCRVESVHDIPNGVRTAVNRWEAAA